MATRKQQQQAIAMDAAREKLHEAWMVAHYSHNRAQDAVWEDMGRLRAVIGFALAALNGGQSPEKPSEDAVRASEREWDRRWHPERVSETARQSEAA